MKEKNFSILFKLIKCYSKGTLYNIKTEEEKDIKVVSFSLNSFSKNFIEFRFNDRKIDVLRYVADTLDGKHEKSYRIEYDLDDESFLFSKYKIETNQEMKYLFLVFQGFEPLLEAFGEGENMLENLGTNLESTIYLLNLLDNSPAETTRFLYSKYPSIARILQKLVKSFEGEEINLGEVTKMTKPKNEDSSVDNFQIDQLVSNLCKRPYRLQSKGYMGKVTKKDVLDHIIGMHSKTVDLSEELKEIEKEPNMHNAYFELLHNYDLLQHLTDFIKDNYM